MKHRINTGTILITLGVLLIIVLITTMTYNHFLEDNNKICLNTLNVLGHIISYMSTILIVLGIGLGVMNILSENAKLINKSNEIFKNIDKSNLLSLNADLEIKDLVTEMKTETIFVEHIKLFNESVKHTTGSLNYESVQHQSLNGNDYFYHALKKLKYDFSVLAQNNGEIKAITFQVIENGDIDKSNLEALKKFTINVYENFYKEQRNSLATFFSTIRSILMYIRQISNKEKQIYFLNTFALHLTSEELGLLFYNELKNIDKQYSNYKWLDENEFFSDIEADALIQPWIQYKFYPNTRFKFLEK